MKNVLKMLWRGMDFVVAFCVVLRLGFALWQHHWEVSWAYFLTALFFASALLSDRRWAAERKLTDAQRVLIKQMEEATTYYRELAVAGLTEDQQLRIREEEVKARRVQ